MNRARGATASRLQRCREYEPYTGYFWPWRASEIEKQVEAFPNFHYRVEAWDCYKDHVFLQTQYYIYIG